MEKWEPSYSVGGNVNWYGHYGRFLKKLKIKNFFKLKIELP